MREFQAGGTDVQDRRRRGIAAGELTHLRPSGDLDRIAWKHNYQGMEAANIGALVRIATLANDSRIRAEYPGLAVAAGGLATPQIRAVATVGGGLLQRTRCWYYRDPAVSCFKKGGDTCPCREGDHLYGACIDLGPCVWPHPSTLGAALLCYDAIVMSEQGSRPIADLFGDGSDPTRDHHLPEGDVLTAVQLCPPLPGEQGAYLRVAGRVHSEWPLVEVVVRLKVDNGKIVFASVGLGGVANVPLRIAELDKALCGLTPDANAIARAVSTTMASTTPIETTRYKFEFIPVAVADACINALVDPSTPKPFQAARAVPWTNA